VKKIEAVIKPFKLDDVQAGLGALEATGLTVVEVSSCGLGLGAGGDGAHDARIATVGAPKVKLEIIVEDERAVLVAEAIERAAHTGRDGDGTITILRVDEAVRIRTGERGDAAI